MITDRLFLFLVSRVLYHEDDTLLLVFVLFCH